MQNAPAPRSARDFCSVCGFPLRGALGPPARCEACGATVEARRAPDEGPVDPGRLRSYASPADADGAGLEQAAEAFRAGDLPRAVEMVLAREAGATLRSVTGVDGAGWAAVVRGSPVFVTIRYDGGRSGPAGADELSLEAPIARLPPRRRLPALRLALELCACEAAASRACLRGEILLLRFTARLSRLTPAVLRHHLREVGHLATRYAGLMIAGLDALPAGLDAIGRPRKILFADAGGAPPQAEKSRSRPAMAAVIAPEPVSPVVAPALSREARSRADTQRIPRRVTPSLDETPRVPIAMDTTPPQAAEPPGLPPADRLCMLLRTAQSLASLALEERPPTMTWVVRSAVFRAIYEYRDLLPDAIAHLYRCTGVAREAPASRTSGQLQATEPVLVVMERIIVARGQMPKERPLAIEPMTSAAQAREHVARYLSEIERAPNDAALRHFLAVGALTELLVRTKLPPQTDQRLRDILAHAQREGARGTSLELMMTALQRINA